MAWVTFTADDIKSRMSSREIAVYEDTAAAEYPVGDGAVEIPVSAVPRINAIVEQITDRFRGAIQANPRTISMGATGTIPAFCIGAAAILGRVALIGLNPVQEGMTDPRRDEYRSAEKFLESLSEMDPQAFEDEIPTENSFLPSYSGKPLLDF